MHYNVIIELDERPTPERADALIDAFAGYNPAVGTSQYGLLEIVITLPADNLRQAVATGLAVVEGPASRARTVQALPTDDYETRLDDETLPEIMGVTAAAAELGISRQAVLEQLDRGTLPGRRAGKGWAISAAAVHRRKAASR